MKPYPLVLRPMLFPKVWGGDRLARFGKTVKPGERIGESWELADLDATSASGAGGSAARSIIDNGALAGKTIREAMRAFGAAKMLGVSTKGNVGDDNLASFPLLVKFLDARENLSVQVHPSIAYAKAHPGANIKTECWYILDAEPGSVIYKGLRDGVTRESFERKVRSGDGSGVVDDLAAVPAVVGEMHNLPSGTIHALGAGVVVAEVQTPSDTTFRVYDWGRTGRELHIDAAIECIMWGPAREAARGVAAPSSGVAETRLVSTGFYVVDELRSPVIADVGGGRGGLVGGFRCRLTQDADATERACVLMCVAGRCDVMGDASGDADTVELGLGQTMVVPAACACGAVLRMDPGAVVLRAVVMG